MKILNTHFSKNGHEYTLMKRNDKVALFQPGPTEYSVGYEVSRIYLNALFSFGGYCNYTETILKHF